MKDIVSENVKFDFNDILIKPAAQSDIQSRKEINPFYQNGFLPIYTAPMDMVISSRNELDFFHNKINICLPRFETPRLLESFESYSLVDFKRLFITTTPQHQRKQHILIDIANGHISDLTNTVKTAKDKYGDSLVLMVGNVANAETYRMLSDAGADLIRVGIGNGGNCLTSKQLGVGYPLGSLIRECYYESLTLKNSAKIVADGGMKSYSDIIKSLAIGSDYVMIGNIFNKAIESCGDNYLYGKIKVSSNVAKIAFNHSIPLYKKCRGMSTKEVQKKWGNSRLKTSEGIVSYNKVEYTLSQWVENFEDYLRSAMSYTNSRTLNDFIGKVELTLITDNAYKRFNK